ncbi:MAG: molybdopterin molybdotransferase MoeA [Deltaproteobacteria bacterium]|nr:molybdopterin molybdotransferase MoeA [Deltaproteobacteria bacterium]
MIRLEEAQKCIVEITNAIEHTQTVNLLDSIGYVLAQPIHALFDQPPFTNSAMDGWAVRYEDVCLISEENSIELEVCGFQQAGSAARTLEIKSAIEIATGAPVPQGADTVIKKEDVAVLQNKISISKPVKRFDNIRNQGEDVHLGQVLLGEGEEIGAKHIGLIASQGIDKLTVFRKPRILYIATGDELIQVGYPREAYQIYNSNALSLAALFSKAGCEFKDFGICYDTHNELCEWIQRAIDQKPDILVLTGGVSVGRYDYVKEVLESLKADIFFHKVRIKPGKPILCAKIGNSLIFGLPGNPLSAQVGFYEFIVPAIQKLRRQVPLFLSEKKAILIKSVMGGQMHKFIVGFQKHENGNTFVEALEEVSGNVCVFAKGNCFISIPESNKEFKAGELVTIQTYEERKI